MKLLLKKSNSQNTRLLLTGTLLFVIYYVADCTLDSLVFGEGSITDNLLRPSLHEVAIRTLSGIFLFALYFISSHLLYKNQGLQENLLKQSREILANNREIDAYNYALSHELRTSVTHIMLAKELIMDSYGKNESNDEKTLFSHLQAGCNKLSEQIDNMLVFAETNRIELERKRVTIDDIVREIALELSVNTEKTALDFQIDNNLVTDCDPDLMRIALKNLIDNAVKFRCDNHHNEIHIGVQQRRGVPVYFIRDNGIGFDQDDAHRLLRPFEKASMEQAIPGNGVGLATANTIIERHGGRLWAESTPGAGATFYFTL